jgi:hypothetical protein
MPNGLMPMRIQARHGSTVEKQHFERAALPSGFWKRPKAIAPGIDPAPLDDLVFHGGKVIPQMEFQNVYLGGKDSWKETDVASIERASLMMMRHRRLNNVMKQYFPNKMLGCDVREGFVLEEPKPAVLDEPDVQAIVTRLYDKKLIRRSDLGTTIFNLVLPSGTVLKLDGSSSLNGLGGYHGSTHIKRNGKTITLYYSANCYSEVKNGRENGIAVFNKPWKNVVGTLYHEMQEFRTDPDVGDAIRENEDDFLGWTSRRGHEIGDQPIFVASDLQLVFKEVKAMSGTRKLPVQFMYSNAVHGAEGPISKPHA